MGRFVAYLCCLVFVWCMHNGISDILVQQATVNVAMSQMDTDGNMVVTRVSENSKEWLNLITIFFSVFLVFCFLKPFIIRGANSVKKLMMLLVAVMGLVFMQGCYRPYDQAEYKEIKPNETAFLIPLEDGATNQKGFKSADFLKEKQVAAKRIQIRHRWQPNARFWQNVNGYYLPIDTLVVVDRSPVTSEWTASKDSGTSKSNQAIWVESSDSVGFSTGFSCSAMITEEDSSIFLYRYSGKSLREIMDSEIRARVQGMVADFSANYKMDDLRSMKSAMMDKVKSDVVPFFKERGITITTIGNFGGFEYENPKIQEAIDGTFIAQQKKVVAKAELEAQKDINTRLQEEGQGEASKLAAIAQGEADRIKLVAQAASEAQKNPLFFDLRKLEVEAKRVEVELARANKWDGKMPTWYMGSGNAPDLLMSVTAPK